MKHIVNFVFISVAAMLSPIAVCAGTTEAQPSPANAAQPTATIVEGEVRKIDKDAKKITIKHGPIPNLAMPGMTMVFHVKDPAMLDQVNVGDRITFAADNMNGAITITTLEVAR